MAFTLLRMTPHGWTDHHDDVSVEFATEEEARDASIELDDCWATASDWKIVSTEDLGNYDII